MRRKTILIDLDNVVYDFIGTFADWLHINDAISHHKPQLMEMYRNWEVWDDWGMPKGEFHRWWRLGVERPYIYRFGEVIPGAREALWRLSDAEWDIHIATSRLTKFGLHDQIVLNTTNWLHENNIPYRNLHFVDNKHMLTADVIVDDRSDNMGPSHEQHWLFPANHNADFHINEVHQADAWNALAVQLDA